MSQYMEVVSTQDLINDISSAVETQALSGYVAKTDLVTTITGDSTNTEAPGALAVKNYVDSQITTAMEASY